MRSTRQWSQSIALVLMSVGCCWAFKPVRADEPTESGKLKLVLDCDTANEIDDLYAITRRLRQDKFNVLALTSAQWFHYKTDIRSVYASQRLNVDLVRMLGRVGLPTPVGSEEPMGRRSAERFAAARFMIDAALSLPQTGKLHVVCTGTSINLASAIKLEPWTPSEPHTVPDRIGQAERASGTRCRIVEATYGWLPVTITGKTIP